MAIQMEAPKNAQPRSMADLGVTPNVPAHPSLRNRYGAHTMRTQVRVPDASWTSPIAAEYSAGDGCKILN